MRVLVARTPGGGWRAVDVETGLHGWGATREAAILNLGESFYLTTGGVVAEGHVDAAAVDAWWSMGEGLRSRALAILEEVAEEWDKRGESGAMLSAALRELAVLGGG